MIVHIIVNSHLDPVWMWEREHGIDEVLNTARTACDLLDVYPELIINRGESWFYEIVEKYAPVIFRRIKAHVASRRWNVVGGWYVQPDCNLASPETYRKHGEIAGKYFREKFGINVQTGYNVDSFGHNAMLPSFYTAAGMKNYVFMRPMKHEKSLPANDFIWRAPDGSEILTSRIICSYASWNDDIGSHVQASLEEANPKLGHVMCFIGVGDHGGGPFRQEVEYILEHKHYAPGVELQFSTPDAYFEAVRKSGIKLPVIEGELQHHAIGCYSAFSKIKRELRKTENYLTNFGHLLTKPQEEAAWKKVLFSSFHDVLAGSCIRAGYSDLIDSLGGARDIAFEAFLKNTRQQNQKLPPSSRQRIIFDNTAAQDFRGYVTCQPTLNERWKAGSPVSFFELDGTPFPIQQIPTEISTCSWDSFLLHLNIPANGRKILEVDYGESTAPAGKVSNTRNGFTNGLVAAAVNKTGISTMTRGKTEFLASPVEAVIVDDPSDTWSHNMNQYATAASDRFKIIGKWEKTITGSRVSEYAAKFADSNGNTLVQYIRIANGIPGIQMHLALNWHSARKMVKLVIRPAFKVTKRMDGIPGAILKRALNGEEYPVFNRVSLYGGKHNLTVLSNDVFSADVQPDGTLRMTLLRSPYFAHHDPDQLLPFSKCGVTDQGEIEFDLTLLADADEQEIADEILSQSNPVFFSETTYGMLR